MLVKLLILFFMTIYLYLLSAPDGLRLIKLISSIYELILAKFKLI